MNQYALDQAHKARMQRLHNAAGNGHRRVLSYVNMNPKAKSNLQGGGPRTANQANGNFAKERSSFVEAKSTAGAVQIYRRVPALDGETVLSSGSYRPFGGGGAPHQVPSQDASAFDGSGQLISQLSGYYDYQLRPESQNMPLRQVSYKTAGQNIGSALGVQLGMHGQIPEGLSNMSGEQATKHSISGPGRNPIDMSHISSGHIMSETQGSQSTLKSCLQVPQKTVMAEAKASNAFASGKTMKMSSQADLMRRRLLNMSLMNAAQPAAGEAGEEGPQTLKINDGALVRQSISSQIG